MTCLARGFSIWDVARVVIVAYSRKRGADVTGIDGSEKLINIAKARSDSSIKFLVRNANNLDGIVENGFEIVVAAMSLMSVEDYEGSISEVRRVLKKGGYLLMSILHPCFSDHFTNRPSLLQSTRLARTCYHRI